MYLYGYPFSSPGGRWGVLPLPPPRDLRLYNPYAGLPFPPPAPASGAQPIPNAQLTWYDPGVREAFYVPPPEDLVGVLPIPPPSALPIPPPSPEVVQAYQRVVYTANAMAALQAAAAVLDGDAKQRAKEARKALKPVLEEQRDAYAKASE